MKLDHAATLPPAERDNHGRAAVTVRFCPNCGVVVNERILAREFTLEEHARRRRSQSAYCVDCGQELVRQGSAR
jgi:hypothetical protein